jgi:hypothetical protein
MYKLFESYDVIYPSFVSDESTDTGNVHLNKAYSLIRRIKRGIKNKEELPGSIITDVFMELNECSDEESEDNMELCANILWLFFVWWNCMFDTKMLRDVGLKWKLKKLKTSDLLEIEEKNSEEMKDTRAGFVETFDDMINEVIKELKTHPEWADLGDYYLALRYFTNMVDTDYPVAMNKAIGLQMMLSYVQMGNKYAIVSKPESKQRPTVIDVEPDDIVVVSEDDNVVQFQPRRRTTNLKANCQ